MERLLLLVVLIGYANAVCPTGWTENGNSCYHLSRSEASWVEATRMCELHGSFLARVETETEERYLNSLIRSEHHHSHNYWLGGTDWTVEGNWEWEAGGSDFLYTDWYPGQPGHHGSDENCLALRGSVTFKWSDEDCTEKYRYICEKRAPGPVLVPGPPIATAAPQVQEGSTIVASLDLLDQRMAEST